MCLDASIHLSFSMFSIFYATKRWLYYILIDFFVLSCQLEELQSKVRSDVSSEYWLRLHCAYPDKQLFDWGMMRLRRPMYGLGDAFAMEADENLKKKRDAEVIFCLFLTLALECYST